MTDIHRHTDETSPAKHRKPRKRDAGKALVTNSTDTARDLARRTSAGIEANPLSVLVGGVALGVLAGAFIPRSERETQLLGTVGKRLTDSAKGAIDAAKETARSEFDILGLTRTAAKGQASKLIEGVLGAVTSAGAAAIAGQRKKADAEQAKTVSSGDRASGTDETD